jgi:hypothetical protein
MDRLTDGENHGCLVDRGTWVCSVAADSHWQVEAQVEASDVAFLRPGQSAQLVLGAYPWRVFQARVTKIASGPVEPKQEPNAKQATPYSVQLELDPPWPELRTGMTGRCAIEVERTTLLAWLARRVASLWRMW